jgi:hypothetical protein
MVLKAFCHFYFPLGSWRRSWLGMRSDCVLDGGQIIQRDTQNSTLDYIQTADIYLQAQRLLLRPIGGGLECGRLKVKQDVLRR